MKRIILFLILCFPLFLSAQNKIYNKFAQGLDGLGDLEYGWFTSFCNIDMNFAHGRFERYMQNSDLAMTYDDDKTVIVPYKSVQYRFVPRVSSKIEYLDVKYDYETTDKYESWFESEDGKTYLIKQVSITGTPELVLKLFLNYWHFKLNVEGQQNNEIVNYNVLGDFIALQKLSKISKITITPKGFNYCESYGVNCIN